jgi:ribosomal-protein-alanine N-acetyltransferase
MGTTIIELSLPALAAEERSTAELGTLLGVAIPVDWPPPFNDAGTRAWSREQLESNSAAKGWLGYYVVAQVDGIETLVGTAGYKGPPDAEGTVEVGYSIVPAYRRRGIASAALEMLIDHAFADQRVARVTAETPVDFAASRGLLEKCGFVLVGNRTDPEDGDLALYAIERSAARDGGILV